MCDLFVFLNFVATNFNCTLGKCVFYIIYIILQFDFIQSSAHSMLRYMYTQISKWLTIFVGQEEGCDLCHLVLVIQCIIYPTFTLLCYCMGRS